MNWHIAFWTIGACWLVMCWIAGDCIRKLREARATIESLRDLNSKAAAQMLIDGGANVMGDYFAPKHTIYVMNASHLPRLEPYDPEAN